MQKELTFWEEAAKTLFGASEAPIDIQKAEEISRSVLIQVAAVEAAIKKRLTELSDA